MRANKRGSGVDVVHECFPERGDSILSVFSWEPLQAKLQDNYNEYLWLTKSYDQPGCSRAPKWTELQMRICRCTSDRAIHSKMVKLMSE